MNRYSYFRRALVAGVLLIATAGFALTIYAFAVKAEAHRILQDFIALQVGVSTDLDVRRIVEKHRGHLTRTECGDDGCWYFFEVTNRWLARVKVEPDTRFQAWILVARGKVQNLHTEVARDTKVFPTAPSGGIVEESLIISNFKRFGDPHYSFPTPVGKPYLLVAIDKETSAEQRRRAYAFSLSCMVKLGGGCDLPCDYLPLAWKDWEAELTAQGWGFGEYYPSRARCK